MMRFNSETERMQHPEAKLIPRSLWESPYGFGGFLPDDLLPLMRAEKASIIDQIKSHQTKYTYRSNGANWDDWRCYRHVWLAVALGHPDLSAEELAQVGSAVGMDSSALSIASAGYGYLGVLRYLEEKVPYARQDYRVFNAAAQNGHLDVLHYLEVKSDWLQGMIYSRRYNPILSVLLKAFQSIRSWFVGNTPDKLQEMIAAEGYNAFREAAQNGHLEVLRYIEEKAPDKLQEMIASGNYSAFRKAAENGHLEVLHYLEEKAPDKLQEMIAVGDYMSNNHYYKGYVSFCAAAENGHPEVLQYLEEKAPDKLQEMIAAATEGQFYDAFSEAVKRGHLEVLQYLEEKAPDKLQEMIAVEPYYEFKNAVRYGHLNVLRFLEEKAPDKLQEMIAELDDLHFRFAVQSGHLDVLRYLEEKAPDKLLEMIAAENYAVIGRINPDNYVVFHYLLSHPCVFAYAEQHLQEYGDYVNPFLTEKLAELHQQKEDLEAENPNAVFDAADETNAKLLFYMARNLIRQNEPEQNDELLFLLSLPSVRALAHTEVNEGPSNELIRLALAVGNQRAAELLFNIPAVRQLAEQSNFYREERSREERSREEISREEISREEISNGLDASDLARDTESSMTALSQGEQTRLQAAIDRYQPTIKAKGVNDLMDELRAVLLSRYITHPAVMVRSSGERLALPFFWEELQQLSLTDLEFEEAMKAYAKNKDHTAWRYLLKPNPWMHEQASYVNVNPNDYNERWSTFEEYQNEIAMFYLGAIDEASAPTEGYTLETRLDGFVEELALIGRAHNWDGLRTRVDGNGRSIKEEYDDLDSDRPSCFSGVKRRLFQSVKGHLLFSVLTKEIVQAEIDEFVRQHFQGTINEENRGKIKDAWDKIILGDDMETNDWDALKLLDISSEKQSEFRDLLASKYGPQFAINPEFTEQIQSAFDLKQKPDAHVLNFGHLQPEMLFEESSGELADPLSRASIQALMGSEGDGREPGPASSPRK